jgi:hypothetical protein
VPTRLVEKAAEVAFGLQRSDVTVHVEPTRSPAENGSRAAGSRRARADRGRDDGERPQGLGAWGYDRCVLTWE